MRQPHTDGQKVFARCIHILGASLLMLVPCGSSINAVIGSSKEGTAFIRPVLLVSHMFERQRHQVEKYWYQMFHIGESRGPVCRNNTETRGQSVHAHQTRGDAAL